MRIDRRRALALLGVGVARPAAAQAPARYAGAVRFDHGVGSGDPLAGRVILWTRITPADAKALWHSVDTLSADTPHLGAGGFLAHPEPARYFRHQGRAGDRHGGGRGRLRVCEAEQLAAGLSPSSCFNLIGAAQVGKSSLTGMRVLHRLGGRVPVWPFDPILETGPVIIEIYTTIAARAAGVGRGRSKVRDAAGLRAALEALGSRGHARLDQHDDHMTDALITAAWLRANAGRPELWSPAGLTPEIARTEGWTFGVP